MWLRRAQPRCGIIVYRECGTDLVCAGCKKTTPGGMQTRIIGGWDPWSSLNKKDYSIMTEPTNSRNRGSNDRIVLERRLTIIEQEIKSFRREFLAYAEQHTIWHGASDDRRTIIDSQVTSLVRDQAVFMQWRDDHEAEHDRAMDEHDKVHAEMARSQKLVHAFVAGISSLVGIFVNRAAP